MTDVREPAVAGVFYPADPAVLEAHVERLLAAVTLPDEVPDALAYVVPHAGYRFSGPTAAHVYARLRRRPHDRVVVIGPAHRVPLRGAAVPAAGRWRTPLGEVTIDLDGAADLVAAGLAVADDAPHAPEHAIEVQVPFLQRLSVGRILPVCIGQATVDQVAALIERAAGAGALVLCSTDLSHYLTEDEARAVDARTAEAIVALAPERIGPHDACGRFALRGLLGWARSRWLDAEVLALSTSADTGGERGRVVGYPAVSFTAREP